MNSNNVTNLYLNSLYELGLECGIKQYTRVELRNNIITNSCLDHVFVRSVDSHTVHTAVINNAVADHYITGCALAGLPRGSSRGEECSRTVTKLDNELVTKELKSVDWNTALTYHCPDSVLDFIVNKFQCIYKKCIVTIKENSKKCKKCPWFNNKIKNMCKKRNKLYKIWKKDTSNIENRIIYNKYRNKTNKYINYVKKFIL